MQKLKDVLEVVRSPRAMLLPVFGSSVKLASKESLGFRVWGLGLRPLNPKLLNPPPPPQKKKVNKEKRHEFDLGTCTKPNRFGFGSWGFRVSVQEIRWSWRLGFGWLRTPYATGFRVDRYCLFMFVHLRGLRK